MFNGEPDLLKKVITRDESYVYSYDNDTETKVQSSQWKYPEEARLKTARQVWLNVKVLLTVFFDSNGKMHPEVLTQACNVNKKYYREVMLRLHKVIRQKSTELWKNQSWILHHNNLPAHTSMLVSELFAKSKTVSMTQTPYSPDLAPADFSFPQN